jgi:diguanylate cyclase (GGDEF)-like protein
LPITASKSRRAWWLLIMLLLGVANGVSDATAQGISIGIHGTEPSYPLSDGMLYLEDPTQTVAIDTVRNPANAARFKPVPFSNHEINFGYSHSSYWLALPLTVEPDAPARWLLEIAYPSLDRVELYTPQRGGGYSMQVAGDLQPFSERPFPHRNLVFRVDLDPGLQTLYLKVRSEGSLTIPATLWQAEALHEHDQKSYALLSVYYGMLLALLLYNLLLFCATREPVFVYYVAFVAAMAIGQASDNGFGNQFLWPQWPAFGNIAFPAGMAAAGCGGALFTRSFFSTRSISPRLDAILLVIAATFAFAAVSPVVVSYQFGAIFVSIAGLASAVIFEIAGIYCLWKRHPGASYYLLAWTMLLIGVAMLAMRNLAWLPTNAISLHSMQIGSALEMLLLSFALADRLNVMRRAKELATQEAMAAKQDMVDALRRHESELESRVAERTAELERANTQLRDKEKELEHLARTDPLTGIFNRAVLDARLTREISRARRTRLHVAVLLIDLDRFKDINDTLGHAAGDDVLIAVAERLMSSMRDTDTVARLGGDEFVVMMDDLPDAAYAVQVAEKLVDEIGKPYDITGLPVKVGASIGVAVFPIDASDAAGLMACADQAMYCAKAGGRHQWRVADRTRTALAMAS